ncbi:MAG: flagellar biosynthesis protein FlhF [Pseudomonadota bacterium]|nr:flagellar biosynthesis protein FlhF [Pseudomonadota bacterium]
MNVKKFVAPTARDALHKVKEILGPDAIILSNRGLPGGGVEIMAVASRDMAAIAPTPMRETAAPARVEAPRPAPVTRDDDYTVSLSSARNSSMPKPFVPPPAYPERAAPAVAAAAKPAIPPLASRPMPRMESLDIPAAVPRAEAEVVPANVMAEIRALRQIVEQHLAGFAWGETARAEPVKTEVLRQMLDSGFSPQLARDLLDGLPQDLDARQAQTWAKSAADRTLRTLGSDHDIIEKGGVFALVGPTGVGKTTTTAKLAARCVLRHGAHKLALVTTDGYRIGAHEQLRIYGRILGVSVHLVKDGDDLRHTLAELSHKHMVLVDTMGMSQRDRMVTEQIGMLADCGVQRLLLLNATARGDTMDDVVRAYNGPDLAGCILTKVDEAASLAPALDVVMRHGLKLHYVSNGQRVPEDLHLPNRAYLLHRAFKDAPEASPHSFNGVEPGLVMANAGVAAMGGRRG